MHVVSRVIRMKPTRPRRWSGLVRAVLIALLPAVAASPASAQLHDHLKCFKAKDSSAYLAGVDLRPADPGLFEVDAGCTIKVRSRQVCFPVEKDLNTSTAPHLDIQGPELQTAFLCYKLRCPRTVLPESLQMSDQFGTHTLSRFRTTTVCAPAIVGIPPETTTTTTTIPSGTPVSCVDASPPHCDGTCGNFNFACKEEAGACICFFVDVFGGCPMLGGEAPNCWGSCDGSNTCVDAGGGACQCALVVE